MNEKMGISQKRGIFSNPKILPWLFLAPAVGLILVFYGYPIIRTIAISLRDYNVLNPSDSTFVGGKNFSRMLKDGVLKISLKNTVIYVVASLSLQFVLGFALALLLWVIWIFNSADIIYVMTNGGPVNATQTVASYLFQLAYTKHDYSLVCAISVVIMAVLFCTPLCI